MRPSATDSGALAPGPDCWGVWVGLGGRLGMGNSGPGGGAQRERRRGPIAPTLRVWRTCRLEGVPETCSGDSQRSVDYLVDARGFLSLFGRLAPGWALGGHPETSAHPGVEGTRFGEAGPLWARDGLVGARTEFACGTGPAGDAAAFPELYSGLVAADLALCRGPQVFRRWVGRHSQRIMGKEVSFHPDPASQVLSPFLGSNGMVPVVVRLGVRRGLPTVAAALRFPDRAPATAPPFPAINGPVQGGVGRRAPPGCQRPRIRVSCRRST